MVFAQHFFRSAFQIFFIAWVAMTLMFFGARLLPGNIVQVQFAGTGTDEVVVESTRTRLGIAEPIATQYTNYLTHWITGDWGVAWSNGEIILHAIQRSFAITMSISLIGLVLGCVLGFIGVSILHFMRIRSLHIIANVVIDLLIATPIFWSITLLMVISAPQITDTPSALRIAIVVLGIHSAATIVHVVSNVLDDQLTTGYVLTAKSKGLSQFTILYKHIQPNLVLVTVPFITSQLGILLGGTVILESILLLPGMGTLFLTGVMQRDYPLLQGIVTVVVVLVSIVDQLGNLIVTFIDPRLR